MNEHDAIEQLRRIGVVVHHSDVQKIAELSRVLFPQETIKAYINGHYVAGSAVLCATDQRLLLIDKKLFSVTIEDIRYDMICEVDFNRNPFGASVSIVTFSQKLVFTSKQQLALLRLASYIEQRIVELRQQFSIPREEGEIGKGGVYNQHSSLPRFITSTVTSVNTDARAVKEVNNTNES